MVLLSWVLVALSLIALSFSRSVRMEVKATVNEVDLKQSYYIARSGIYYSINRVLLKKGEDGAGWIGVDVTIDNYVLLPALEHCCQREHRERKSPVPRPGRPGIEKNDHSSATLAHNR